MNDFRALGASDAVCNVLGERGIERPFPIQSLVIPEALRGGDVLAKSPTGSGKTLAFAIPIVERLDLDASKPSALVLVPTRELAAQVTEELELVGRPRGVRAAAVYGGVPLKRQADAARRAHVVIATPGRLQDLVDRRMLSIDSVHVLVLDEADRMLDMGFKPQVDRLVRLLPEKRQTMFFSATLDGEVGELARRYTRNPARFEGELPEERRSGEVDHRFVPVTPDNKVQTLVELLPGEEGLALVFVRTKAGADRLVEKLRRHEVDAVAIHGDKAQVHRERALARFDAGKVRTLVATDLAARGLDVEDITHVINFDPPEDPSGYTHRVGRTGRAGRGGTGITLVLPDQQADVSRVARLQGHTERFEESGMQMARPRLVYTSRRGRASKW
jgi:superfamily II DNA/RNA helicase